MEALTLETITLFLAFLTLLGAQIGGMFMLLSRMNDQNKRIDDMNSEMNRRFDTMNSEMNRRFDTMNSEMNRRFDDTNRRFENVDKRFDEVNRQFSEVNARFDTMNQRFDETTLLIGELRDRTGKLEGTLEGFLAGRRDRDAA